MNHDVKELFDAKKDYDAKRDKYYFERRTRELNKLLKQIDKRSKILDVGCGTGITVEFLKENGFENVHGGDISATLLKSAREKNIDQLTLTEEIQLPYKSEIFDAITMFDVIEHMDSYEENMKEVSRILKPGGHVFISYPNPGMIWALDLLAKIGLKIPGKENKVPLKELKSNIDDTFTVEKIQPIVIMSKLPRPVLKFFEIVEKITPNFLLKRVAFSYTLVLKKK
jgi:2-polyprenyl-3-methyl-5-hydroxy-6-metoxy-1,4-benzoquinol methylase